MAWSQDQLTALEAAIAEGALEVQYGERTVKYRSLSDMMQLRELMRRELGLSTSSSAVYPTFSKGLCE